VSTVLDPEVIGRRYRLEGSAPSAVERVPLDAGESASEAPRPSPTRLILNRVRRIPGRVVRFVFSPIQRAWRGWTGKMVDLHTYGGLLLVGFGLWQLHPAAGLAVPGAFLVFMGYWRS
jgi:hypothetical protein